MNVGVNGKYSRVTQKCSGTIYARWNLTFEVLMDGAVTTRRENQLHVYHRSHREG